MICYGTVDTKANIQLSVAPENDIGQGVKETHSHPGKKGLKKHLVLEPFSRLPDAYANLVDLNLLTGRR